MAGYSGYVTRLGHQPGVQLTPVADAVASLSRLDIADRVVAIVARTRRGRMDRPVVVDRSTARRMLGKEESNLVRPIYEARMQVTEMLGSGAEAVVVSRLVPAAAQARYIGVELGALALPVAVASISAPPTVNEGANLGVTVAMTSGAGMSGVPFSVSGVTVLDVGLISFGSGVTLAGGELTVPAGVSSFNITIPVLADQTTEGPESMTIAVGGQSAVVTISDTSLSAPPPSYVYDVEATGGWMHPKNPYNVPYIIPQESKLLIHPGPGLERPIVAFTNTFGAGEYRVVVSTPPDDQADLNYLHVVRGGAVIGPVTWPGGDFDSVLTLAAGESLEFTLMGPSYSAGGRYIVADVWKMLPGGPVKVASSYDDFAAASGSPTATWAYFYRSDDGYPNGVINSAGPMLPIGGAVPQSTVVSVVAQASVDEGSPVVFAVTMNNAYGANSVPFSISGVSTADHGSPVFDSGVTLVGGNLVVPYGVDGFNITIPVLLDSVTYSEVMVVSVGGASDAVSIVDVTPPEPDGAAILALSPALWIDPSDESLMTKTGSFIEAIQDKSGFGRHCTKSGSPYFSSANLPGAIVLGNNGFDIGGPALSMQEYTVYAVVYLDLMGQSARSITFLANGNIAVGCNAAMIFTSGTQSYAGLQLASPSAYAYTGGVSAIGAGAPRLVTLKQKGTWGSCEFTLDGAVSLPRLNTSGSTPAATFTFIGKQSTYAAQGWELGEMVVIPRAATEEEDSVVESYLKAKWGVA